MAAKSAWETLDAEDKELYSLSAAAAIELMFAKELNIDTQTCDVFRIYINRMNMRKLMRFVILS